MTMTGPEPPAVGLPTASSSARLVQVGLGRGAGESAIMTRAEGAAGDTQPGRVPSNEKRCLFSQPLPHPVRVS